MNTGPLIAICGTTGVGKSKLAVELATALLRFKGSRRHDWIGGRVINADSMQAYAGMDIITNKVSESERHGVEHLLMSFKQPGERYVVGEWVHDAIKVIDETHARRQIPIVVGGTAYWIQHLILPDRLSSSFEQLNMADSTFDVPLSDELRQSVENLSPDLRTLFQDLPKDPPSAPTDPRVAFSLHSLLNALDPIVGSRWHWKDTRKVLRSLCIIKETGRKPSNIWSEQSNVSVKPRYRTLCFWLYAEPSALHPRLDERVNGMIKQGLLDEIHELRNIAAGSDAGNLETDDSKNNTASVDYTLGIYQAIGYKEFHDYLNSPAPTEKAFVDAVDRMKLSTRQYARRQVGWIRNKFLPAVHAAKNDNTSSVSVYLLDATNLGDAWHTNVRDVAERLMEDFLAEYTLPDPSTLSETARTMLDIKEKATSPTAVLNARRKIICPICTINEKEPVMIEEGNEWDAHRKTRVHRGLAGRATRAQEVMYWKNRANEVKQTETSASSDLESVAGNLRDLFTSSQ